MSKRSYLRVLWQHESSSEPVDLWSELDERRYETRKIEYFRDGSVGYADGEVEVGGTRLGEVPVPPLADIAADPQFKPEPISESDFEDHWKRREQSGRR